ncbi:MAG: hypothetical protein ACKOB1_03120 [Planctomycetia bacterium]
MMLSREYRAAVRVVTGAVIAIAVWCGLLPRLLSVAPVARHVRLMEERGVDPAAMYYTELERLPLPPPWVEDRVILWP